MLGFQPMFAAALLLAASAQQQPPPSFRTGVNLVEVDAVVTDRAHAPIRGLKKDDFEVLEDGRPVDIATFVAIDLPADPPDTHFPPANLSYSTVASNDYSYDGR